MAVGCHSQVMSLMKRLFFLPLAFIKAGLLNFFLTLITIIPPLKNVGIKWLNTVTVTEVGEWEKYLKPLSPEVGDLRDCWIRTKRCLLS